MNILDRIAEKTKERVAEQKRLVPDPLKAAEGQPVLRRCDSISGMNTAGPFPFEKALRRRERSRRQADELAIIAEVKKASPSKGIIAENFPYLEIAENYDCGGADAISCLTEPYWFKGKNEYLTEIRRNVDIPILRKDFTVDDYMIYEAKAIGADAVLLIVSILDPVQLKDYLQLSQELGLSAIVEAHSAEEIETGLQAGARIIGVNNRNLKDFSVDVSNAGRLRDLVPPGVLFISESGVKTREDVRVAEEMGADAVLVGESLMRSESKAAKLMELTGRPPMVKTCGLMSEEDVTLVNEAKPDYAGFVFAKTRHYVSPDLAADLRKKLDPGIKPVGVFVDTPAEEVIQLLKAGTIEIAQLHGDESNEEIEAIRKATGRKVIKAIVVRSAEDIRKADLYPAADYILFDAGKGSGTSFNWGFLKNYRGEKPFFLAGGLNPENVAEAIAKVRPFAVDVSSGIESRPGAKDRQKLEQFMNAVSHGDGSSGSMSPKVPVT
ncbi:MAG: indole-3-glycerol phosphate synthase TrpC [Eubacterium sp.]|nr:indole-3-glycerol phosphate synthase TrpC [Eubacterium sp.]